MELTEKQVRLMLSFCPDDTADDLPKGAMPMFYHPLTYSGDLEISKQLDEIRAKLDKETEKQ